MSYFFFTQEDAIEFMEKNNIKSDVLVYETMSRIKFSPEQKRYISVPIDTTDSETNQSDTIKLQKMCSSCNNCNDTIYVCYYYNKNLCYNCSEICRDCGKKYLY